MKYQTSKKTIEKERKCTKERKRERKKEKWANATVKRNWKIVFYIFNSSKNKIYHATIATAAHKKNEKEWKLDNHASIAMRWNLQACLALFATMKNEGEHARSNTHTAWKLSDEKILPNYSAFIVNFRSILLTLHKMSRSYIHNGVYVVVTVGRCYSTLAWTLFTKNWMLFYF